MRKVFDASDVVEVCRDSQMLSVAVHQRHAFRDVELATACLDHLHAHCDGVVRAKCAKTLSLFRLQQLVIVASMHRVCAQSTQEAFVYFFNLADEALTHVVLFSGCA